MSYTPQTVDLTGIEPVDLRALTLGEVAYIEMRTGTSLKSFGDDDAPMGATLTAIAGVVLFRAGRYETPEDAQEAAGHLTLAQAQSLITAPATEDDPAGE